MSVLKFVIFSVVIVVVLALLMLLPSIAIDPNEIISSAAWSWVMAAMYFIPTHTIITILGIVVLLGVWSLIVAVVKVLWDLLPFA